MQTTKEAIDQERHRIKARLHETREALIVKAGKDSSRQVLLLSTQLMKQIKASPLMPARLAECIAVI